jgi:glycosyltransferase involved in cell wall biosynthesis
MSRTLVLSPDPLGAEMAGPAIRATELARAVGAEARFSQPHAPGDLHADVIVAHPPWPLAARALRRSGARLIYDLYDPEPLEALQFLRGRRPALRSLVTAMSLDRLVNALHDGHAFLCASERQRDLWTGALLALRLISPRVHDEDPSLSALLAVVPFGLPDEPPQPGPGPRERFGLGEDAEIVLWNGGIWGWLDAESALLAVARLASRRPRLRLVFMGAAGSDRARELAAELGLLGRAAFFNDGWVPYADRGAWLLQADVALSAHRDHLEARYAHRTRVLDCLWAGLPVVCTEGDDLAARVSRQDLGAAVPPGDPAAIAVALETVLDRGRAAYAPQLERAAADLRWSRVAEPLKRLIADPGPTTPLGSRAGRPRPTSPILQARDAAYTAARTVLNAAGRRDWPRMR